MPHEKSLKYAWKPWNDDWFCPTLSVVLKIFDHWGDVLICLLINTSTSSHWLKSVAWPVGPVLKFRDIPDCVMAWLPSWSTKWTFIGSYMEYKPHTILSLTVASTYSLRKLISVSYSVERLITRVWCFSLIMRPKFHGPIMFAWGSTAIFSHVVKRITVLLPL